MWIVLNKELIFSTHPLVGQISNKRQDKGTKPGFPRALISHILEAFAILT